MTPPASSITFSELFELIFYGVATIITAGAVVRVGLIAAGVLKSPIMTFLARYDTSDTYFLLPQALLVLALFVGSLSGLLGQIEPRAGAAMPIAGILAVLSYGAWMLKNRAAHHAHILALFPLWIVRLTQETTREERRRIAFLWLRLPQRARWRYDFSPHHFALWCDLVILGTVTQTMHDGAVREVGQIVSDEMLKRLYP
ncbi:MAG: hypothetical protein SGJ24_18325 [Chloroflexota bacterium]|nr:hypothetical protein [Chloroflexota bacterium]